MCQDKNEVINYYRHINIPGQVRVRLVIFIFISDYVFRIKLKEF